jgi:hypothetical protein
MCIFQGAGVSHRLAFRLSLASVRLVPNDAAQPGAEFVRLTQKPEIPPRADERFLGYFLALAYVSGRAVGKGTDQGLVSFNNLAEGIPASLKAVGYQIGVVAIRCVHRLGCRHRAL